MGYTTILITMSSIKIVNFLTPESWFGGCVCGSGRVSLRYQEEGERLPLQTEGITNMASKTSTPQALPTVAPRGFLVADAADVRTWAGIPLNQRGRLSRQTILDFNKAHGSGKGRMIFVGNPAKTTEVTVKADGDKGRKVTVKAEPSAIRAWGLANGYDVKEGKGRLSTEVREAYAREHLGK